MTSWFTGSASTIEKPLMYPSSCSRRAISSFMREVGMATVSCIARFALRMRLSMSAIGSVSISSSLPAGLGHSRNGSLVREVAEADPAELVAAEHGARPAAAVAARVGANAVLRLALLLHAERGLGHVSYASLLSVANGIPS